VSEETAPRGAERTETIVAGERPLNDPFDVLIDVPVPGGELHVACAGPAPAEADAVVLAVHGLFSSRMAFVRLARELSTRPGVCLLAPDLRGRGRSHHLPGPYGVGAHLTDLLDVLDHVGVERAVLAGHSMGAHIVARLAADHPDRAMSVVLLDGGLELPLPPGYTAQKALDEVLQQALFRLRMTYSTVDEYVGLWQDHPATQAEWNDDVAAYARYDLAGEPGKLSVVISEASVIADCTDLSFDRGTLTAVDRVRAPLHLVRAGHGLFDDDPLLPAEVVDAFIARHPDAEVDQIAGVNHYTLVLGRYGPARVAADIERAIERGAYAEERAA
jgi:lipase